MLGEPTPNLAEIILTDPYKSTSNCYSCAVPSTSLFNVINEC